MQQFIGTKVVLAVPMTVGQAIREYGVRLSPDPSGKDRQDDEQGYLVEYENRYRSWSPKDVFDAAYRPVEDMAFSQALEAVMIGRRVCRAYWLEWDMWIAASNTKSFDVQADDLWSPHNKTLAMLTGGSVSVMPTITMKTGFNNVVMGWLPNHSDLFAKDWMILPDLVLEPVDSHKKYYVCVTLDEKSGGWMVTCSAVPELNAVGTDVNDALKQAVNSLATFKMIYASGGRPFPEPLSAGDGELWWIDDSGAYGTV